MRQIEMVSRLAREREAMEARREAEARATAHDLIQLHVGPGTGSPTSRIFTRPSFKPSGMRGGRVRPTVRARMC
jgi:hypothetical protein